MEDSGLQIITLWGPTIGNFENINLEILDLPSPKGSKTRVHGGGGCIYRNMYVYLRKKHMWNKYCFVQSFYEERRKGSSWGGADHIYIYIYYIKYMYIYIYIYT